VEEKATFIALSVYYLLKLLSNIEELILFIVN